MCENNKCHEISPLPLLKTEATGYTNKLIKSNIFYGGGRRFPIGLSQ